MGGDAEERKHVLAVLRGRGGSVDGVGKSIHVHAVVVPVMC